MPAFRLLCFTLLSQMLLAGSSLAQDDSFSVNTGSEVPCASEMQQCFERQERIRETGCTPIEYWTGDNSGCTCVLLVMCSDPQTGETIWEGTAEEFAARQPAPPGPPPAPANTGMLQGGVSMTVTPDTGAEPDADSSCIEPPAPRDVQQEAMALAGQLDAIATEWQDDAIVASGRFFFHMNRAVAAQLRFMAQKPGEPAKQLGQAIVAYLTNDALENHNRLLDGAVAAVRALERDPAATLGAAAGDAVFDAAAGGAAVKFCSVSKKAAAAAAGRIAEAKKAADRLKKVAEAKRQFEAAAFGALSPDDIPRTTKQPPGAMPPVNPFHEEHGHCFWCALAKDKGLETGQPYIVLPFPPEGMYPKGPKIVSVLARRYGSKVTLTRPAHGEGRQLMQDLGLPALMSHDDIVREIASTSGSRGIVFLQDRRKGGHVVNVWNDNGQAYFYDAQSGIEASYLVQQAKTVWLYRTK